MDRCASPGLYHALEDVMYQTLHFARSRVRLCLTLVLALFMCTATTWSATAQPASAAQAETAAASPRVFGSDAGLVLNFIKPDKAADFEAVMAKLKEALSTSPKPERRQQLAGWNIYRAVEPGVNGTVLFVFTIAPAVPGADYTVSTILAEAFPNEVQALYKQYAEAYASGQNILNLKLVPSASQ